MKIIYLTSEEVLQRCSYSTIQTSSDYTLLREVKDTESLAIDLETNVPIELKGIINKALNPHTAEISIASLRARDSNKIFIFDFLAYKQAKNTEALEYIKEVLNSAK